MSGGRPEMQVLRRYNLAVFKKYGPLDDVLQLADVTGPEVAFHQDAGLVG